MAPWSAFRNLVESEADSYQVCFRRRRFVYRTSLSVLHLCLASLLVTAYVDDPKKLGAFCCCRQYWSTNNGKTPDYAGPGRADSKPLKMVVTMARKWLFISSETRC
ncbi:hypothetical protein NPIL_540461 [Nephila pilipes]|uniref:Uncharacterized protein n=1 Tax=Nephila pilipes TaxID=299642 RepID=A0A8X6PR82_NEPPI|nr:hypothetical protein NPIL_540461 [Nephila pilipes]